ncbi:Sperm flagellar protein 1 [Geranomyces michiganensis]|nr:Sperm flagellar protein 1 [Geranomyces michiganensis]
MSTALANPNENFTNNAVHTTSTTSNAATTINNNQHPAAAASSLPSSSDYDELYAWIDEIPLSRPKKNIQRDFSDGVAAAEVISHFLPKLVDLHNYPPANGSAQKIYNWNTLNQKVLRKLNCHLSDTEIEAIVNKQPGRIEAFLSDLRAKIHGHIMERRRSSRGEHSVHSRLSMYALAHPSELSLIDDGFNHHYPQQPPYHHLQQQYGPLPPVSHRGSMQYPLPAQPSAAGYYPFIAAAHGESGGGGATAAASRELTAELQEAVSILQIKARKLEELLALKDARIDELELRLKSHGLL